MKIKHFILAVMLVLALASVPGAWADGDVIVVGDGESHMKEPEETPVFDSEGFYDDLRDITEFPSYERYYQETEDSSYAGFEFWLAEQAERGSELTAVEYAFLASSYTPTLAANEDEKHPGAVETTAGLWYYDKNKAKKYLDRALQMDPNDYRVVFAASSYYHNLGQITDDKGTHWLYRELANKWDKRYLELISQIDPNDESVQNTKKQIDWYEEEVRPFGVGALTSARTAPDLLEADKKPYTSVTERVIQAVVPARGFDPSNPDSLLFYGSLIVLALIVIYVGSSAVIRKRRKDRPRRK
jgi:hypothetical protein